MCPHFLISVGMLFHTRAPAYDRLLLNIFNFDFVVYISFALIFYFFIWVLGPFQEYFTYIEPIIHQRWPKTREPGEKPPDHP